jgi:hypothetical protein
MSIQFLRRKVGAKSTLGSLFGLALIFYLLGLIRSDYISEIFYLTILFTAVITLLVSVVLIGTLNILCG